MSFLIWQFHKSLLLNLRWRVDYTAAFINPIFIVLPKTAQGSVRRLKNLDDWRGNGPLRGMIESSLGE